MADDFFPPGASVEQVLQERFTELHARAAQEFPPSLRLSPLVGNALEQAIQRLRERKDELHLFAQFLREQARDEMATLMMNVEPMIRKLVKQNRGLARVANDVPAEVFFSLHSTQSVFNPEKGAFWGWLHGVTYRVAMRLLSREYTALARTGGGSDPALLVDPHGGPDPAADPIPSYEEILEQLIASLPDATDREILRLKFQDGGQSNERVAWALDLSLNALHKRLSRIRVKLAPLGANYFDLA